MKVTKRDDAIEDAADVAMFDERMRELKAGNDVVLPADVSASILKGESVLLAKMRKALIAAALFGFTAWAIVTFAMMVAKWTSQVRGESGIQRHQASNGDVRVSR